MLQVSLLVMLAAATSAPALDGSPESDLASLEAPTAMNHGRLFNQQRRAVPPQNQRTKRQYYAGNNYYNSPSYGYSGNYGYSNGYNGYGYRGYGSGNGYNYPSYNYGSSYANNNGGYTSIGRIPGYRVEVGAGFECFGSSFTSC